MNPATTAVSLVVALVTFAIFYGISWWVSGSKNLLALATNPDKKPSVSLFQVWIFTVVVVIAYAVTYAARLVNLPANSPMPALPDIPANLVILMGLSVATAAASKGITVSYLRQGEVPAQDQGNLAEGRDGKADLTKAQMLIWTLIAVVVYSVSFLSFMGAGCYLTEEQRITPASNQCPVGSALPDIDGALLVLMGVSAGGYVGGKLVSRTAGPVIGRVLPTPASWDNSLTVSGISFGTTQGKVVLSEKDKQKKRVEEVPATSVTWSDTEIQFKLPDAWIPVDKEVIYIITVSDSDGKAGSLELTVTGPPKIEDLTLNTVANKLAIAGRCFGARQGAIHIDGQPVVVGPSKPITWTTNKIEFDNQTNLAAGSSHTVRITDSSNLKSEGQFTIK